MLCACSSRSALHFDLGVEQACSAAARVLLASPSRTPPSSCSSCLAFLLYEASPHAEVRRLRIHVSCGSALPSSASTSSFLRLPMREYYLFGGDGCVFRPRRQVSFAFAATRLCTLVSSSYPCAVLSACWSAMRLPNSCQPLDADIFSRSRAARSSTALCLTSCLLYSFHDVTMQWDIVESCEESAPGYSANHG